MSTGEAAPGLPTYRCEMGISQLCEREMQQSLFNPCPTRDGGHHHLSFKKEGGGEEGHGRGGHLLQTEPGMFCSACKLPDHSAT